MGSHVFNKIRKHPLHSLISVAMRECLMIVKKKKRGFTKADAKKKTLNE